MSRSRRHWVLFAVALIVQVVAVYSPDAPSEGGAWHLDKLVHAGVFAAVVWTGRRVGLPTFWVIALSAVHAPVSELVQAHFLPHRDGNVPDAIADLVGVGIGALVPIRRGRPEQGRIGA